MSRRRVGVTGLGCVSPVGNTVAEAWSNILAGRSGVGLITRFDASTFGCKIAGEVRGFDLEIYMSSKEARTMDTFVHYGIAAASQAVADSGLPTGDALGEEAATRIGCVIGFGIGFYRSNNSWSYYSIYWMVICRSSNKYFYRSFNTFFCKKYFRRNISYINGRSTKKY